MLKLLRPLIALLGLGLLTAHDASAFAGVGAEKPASGSAAVAGTRLRANTRPSEEAVRENPASSYDLASDSPVAAEGTTTLFRAVSSSELADIEATGAYRSLAGQTEGKYFFDTAEQASNFARMMGDGPYTTTSIELTPGELSFGQRINPLGEGPGYFFPSPNIPSGTVNIFNFSVLP